MEQLPQHNEVGYEPERPRLDIDLRGPDGNVFMVIGMARQQLEGEQLKAFNRDIWEATQPDSGKTYQDILSLVDTYTDFLDTSDLYPQYGREAHIIRAVNNLNTQLRALPPGVECEVTGLYPELDNPDLGPDKYCLLLEEEATRVEYELRNAAGEQQAALQELLRHLRTCIARLRRVGV